MIHRVLARHVWPVTAALCLLVGATSYTLAQETIWSAGPGGTGGTVSSVGLTMPTTIFAVGGSPVTNTGTLAVTVTGTSGGVPFFSGTNALGSSGALTANFPVIGGGAGVAPGVGTRSGNTTAFATVTGSLTNGRCVQIDANGNLVQAAAACNSTAGTVVPATNGFRLTLTTATPVTTADVIGATAIFLTPYTGTQIAIYDGAAWNYCTSAQVTLALGTLADGTKPYDVFAYDSAGASGSCTTLAIQFLVWTSTTARATALVYQDGVLVKSGATGQRYVGTFMPTATTTTEDSAANRYLWGYYSRKPAPLLVIDTTNSWTWNSTSYHQANASAANQVNLLIGVSEDVVEAQVLGLMEGAIAVACGVGIGVDSTSANSASLRNDAAAGVNTGEWLLSALYRGYPGIGKHTLAWLEVARAGTCTFGGDEGVTDQQSGLTATVWR